MNAKAPVWLRLLVPSLAGVAWGGWLLLGVVVISGVRSQRASGYPNEVQWIYYIGLPAIAFGLAVCLVAASVKWKGCAPSIAAAVLLMSALAFMFFFTGGV